MRCAGCVWLVSLVSFSRSSRAIAARLLDIQEAFGGLLGDSGELTQELASRGLSLAYRLGTPDTQKALLDNLVGSLQGEPYLVLRFSRYTSTTQQGRCCMGPDSICCTLEHVLLRRWRQAQAGSQADRGDGGVLPGGAWGSSRGRLPDHLQGAVLAGHRHGPARDPVQVHGPGEPCRQRHFIPGRCFWVSARHA